MEKDDTTFQLLRRLLFYRVNCGSPSKCLYCHFTNDRTDRVIEHAKSCHEYEYFARNRTDLKNDRDNFKTRETYRMELEKLFDLKKGEEAPLPSIIYSLRWQEAHYKPEESSALLQLRQGNPKSYNFPRHAVLIRLYSLSVEMDTFVKSDESKIRSFCKKDDSPYDSVRDVLSIGRYSFAGA
jgi:hypothetical protein